MISSKHTEECTFPFHHCTCKKDKKVWVDAGLTYNKENATIEEPILNNTINRLNKLEKKTSSNWNSKEFCRQRSFRLDTIERKLIWASFVRIVIMLFMIFLHFIK